MAKGEQNRHPYNNTTNAGQGAPKGSNAPGQSGGTGLNPSAPSTGTEGYGLGRGEQGLSNTGGAGITGPNPTGSTPSNEGGGAERTFRCADVGNADCRWEVSGRTEDELMPQIERHGRESHSIRSFDETTRSKIRNAIRERAA